MDKETARAIVQVAVSFDVGIAKLYSLADDLRDPDAQTAIKNCANLMMGLLNRDVILPLVNNYPDINPDLQ